MLGTLLIWFFVFYIFRRIRAITRVIMYQMSRDIQARQLLSQRFRCIIPMEVSVLNEINIRKSQFVAHIFF